MENVIKICSLVTALAGSAALFLKIISHINSIKRGQMCILRQQMLETYYYCLESKQIREYRYQNFMYSYEAYKALGGNSFIDHIKNEVEEFTVVK